MPNLLTVLGAALIPMILGFIWYNPSVFGKAWMSASGMTDEKVKSGNMLLIFGLSFVLSFLLAFALYFIVVHQTAFFSLFATEPGFDNGQGTGPIVDQFNSLMEQFKGKDRNFGHGAFHGVFDALLIIVPIFATNALFERKSFKYVAVNCGYWILCLALMSGVLSQWG